jgi:hypothetical protein
MAATKLQMNWSGVSFGATAITRITTMDINPNGSLIHFKGDDDRYPVVVVNPDNEPSVSITSGDVGTIYGFAAGATGTITATLNDARGATVGSGGAINFTVINCVFSAPTMSAGHGSIASATGNWSAYSPDGQTSPVSFTRS